MATEAEIAAIRLRWQRITADEWKRLQHWIEDENDFTAHARADIATLLAELDGLRADSVAYQSEVVQPLVDELAEARAQAERDQAVMQAADMLASRVDAWQNEPLAGVGEEYQYAIAGHEDAMGRLCDAYWDARRAATATPGARGAP